MKKFSRNEKLKSKEYLQDVLNRVSKYIKNTHSCMSNPLSYSLLIGELEELIRVRERSYLTLKLEIIASDLKLIHCELRDNIQNNTYNNEELSLKLETLQTSLNSCIIYH